MFETTGCPWVKKRFIYLSRGTQNAENAGRHVTGFRFSGDMFERSPH
jgi:hypothetical protein